MVRDQAGHEPWPSDLLSAYRNLTLHIYMLYHNIQHCNEAYGSHGVPPSWHTTAMSLSRHGCRGTASWKIECVATTCLTWESYTCRSTQIAKDLDSLAKASNISNRSIEVSPTQQARACCEYMATLRDIAQEEADDQFRQEAALRSVNAQWNEWPANNCTNEVTSVYT